MSIQRLFLATPLIKSIRFVPLLGRLYSPKIEYIISPKYYSSIILTIFISVMSINLVLFILGMWVIFYEIKILYISILIYAILSGLYKYWSRKKHIASLNNAIEILKKYKSHKHLVKSNRHTKILIPLTEVGVVTFSLEYVDHLSELFDELNILFPDKVKINNETLNYFKSMIPNDFELKRGEVAVVRYKWWRRSEKILISFKKSYDCQNNHN